MDSLTPEIVLYGRPYNRSDRVQWTLEELQVPYRYHKLDVFGLEHRDAKFRAKYGLARLPFLEVDGNTLFESGAMMIFLADRFRSRLDLLPAVGLFERYVVLQWLFFANSTLDSADATLESNSEPGPFVPLTDALSYLDSHLDGRSYIALNTVTIADLALANNLKYCDQEMVRQFSELSRYFDELTSRPAYRRIEKQSEYPR
jgi:glutathione S-transferase